MMEYFFNGLRLNVDETPCIFLIIDCGSVDLCCVQAKNLHIILPRLILFISNSKPSMYISWLLRHYEIIFIKGKFMQHCSE